MPLQVTVNRLRWFSAMMATIGLVNPPFTEVFLPLRMNCGVPLLETSSKASSASSLPAPSSTAAI